MANLDTSSKITCVLFDLDGTLLDTAPDMTNALNLLLAEEDKAPLTNQACRDFVSHGSVAMINLGFGMQQTPEEFERRRLRFLHLYENNLCLDYNRTMCGQHSALSKTSTVHRYGCPCLG